MLLRKGILIGLVINIGIGSIAWHCVGITLEKGFRRGWLATWGMTLTDLFYSILLIAGVSQVQEIWLPYKGYLLLLAGILLLLLGARQLHHKIKASRLVGHEKKVKSSIGHDIATVFFMTVVNPVAILSYVATFSLFGVPEVVTPSVYIALLSGVVIGALVWWTPVIALFAYVKKKVSKKINKRLTAMTSLAMMCIGIYLIIDSLRLHLI